MASADSTTGSPTEAKPKKKKKRINVRKPDVMKAVQGLVESHYKGDLVEILRANGGLATIGDVTFRLAKEFGFCYGVERAIDLAYAARRVFPDRPLYIIGEIIHNPDVNAQIKAMGIKNLVPPNQEASIDDLTEDDVVILPAFGAETKIMEEIEEKGCSVVDTTCGDVMSVWKRVRNYAKEEVTSIIHGKASHEETRATASRALGKDGTGQYLVVLTLAEVDTVCDYIRNGGDRQEFLDKFKGAYSEGFNPDVHLRQVGVANQTTMLREETEEVQRRINEAIKDRDGEEKSKESFRFFDTICGATQERQDALKGMLDKPMDILLVVGGYNSSNTTHLAEMGEAVLPTYFIRNAGCLRDKEVIRHFDFHNQKEITSQDWMPGSPAIYGITAGASCPNNLIEDTIVRILELNGISKDEALAKFQGSGE
jgi:4-hydroxy-3-methylbut-2-enyl diphosphate reductase